MQLFSPDLFRNLAVGFMLGALAVGAAASKEWDAQAANPVAAAGLVEPSDDFRIGAKQ